MSKGKRWNRKWKFREFWWEKALPTLRNLYHRNRTEFQLFNYLWIHQTTSWSSSRSKRYDRQRAHKWSIDFTPNMFQIVQCRDSLEMDIVIHTSIQLNAILILVIVMSKFMPIVMEDTGSVTMNAIFSTMLLNVILMVAIAWKFFRQTVSLLC